MDVPVAMVLFVFIAYYQAIDLLIYNMAPLRLYLFFGFWIVLLVFFGQSEHYRLKFNGEVPKSGSLQRTNLETYFLTWAKDRYVSNDTTDVFLVATEGGGSRSGAWTSAVLTELDWVSRGRSNAAVLPSARYPAALSGRPLPWPCGIIRKKRAPLRIPRCIATGAETLISAGYSGETISPRLWQAFSFTICYNRYRV
ncbi:MAG: hypothetical protein IPJ82_12485 [Lewinellaceae bacterium]|nr:hypothetical protein [Lewinellaceae bacterium]